MELKPQHTRTAKLVLRGSQLVCGILVLSTGAYVLSEFMKLDKQISTGLAEGQASFDQAVAAGAFDPATVGEYNATAAAAYQAAMNAALDAVRAATAGNPNVDVATSTGSRKLMQWGYYSGTIFAGVKNRLGYVVFAGITMLLHAAHYLALALSRDSPRLSCNMAPVTNSIVEVVLTFVLWVFMMAAGGVLAAWGTCPPSSGVGTICGSYNTATAFSWIAWLLLIGSLVLAVLELLQNLRVRRQQAQDPKAGLQMAAPQVIVSTV